MEELMKKIDPEKLRKEIKKRNMKHQDVSETCLYSKSYTTWVLRRGEASVRYVDYLQKKLNITYDDIKPEEPKPEPEQISFQVVQEAQPEVIKQDLDWKKLYQTIYVATLRAFKAALEGDGEHEQI